MLLIRENESQIQDLWNRKSKSNLKICLWLVNFGQFNSCETLCNASFKAIDKIQWWLLKLNWQSYFISRYNFKMFIFNIYKNLFDSYNSFALLQKCRNFLYILMIILP